MKSGFDLPSKSCRDVTHDATISVVNNERTMVITLRYPLGSGEEILFIRVYQVEAIYPTESGGRRSRVISA